LGEIQDMGVFILGESRGGLLPEDRSLILETLKNKVK
jgi:hypothetical protein